MIPFSTVKPLEPVPEIADLNAEERGAWDWMTSKDSFDAMLINLTPRLARLLLDRIGDNRKPKVATVQRYAREMTRRQWKLTHQGIAISTRFEVIDGQHRLRAVIEAKVDIEVLVVRGVSQDALLVLDNGVPRSDTDAIRISDRGLHDLESGHTAAAKRMMRGARRFLKKGSREDLRLFIFRHRTAIKLVWTALWKAGRVPNVTHSDIVAVLARASYHCSREDLILAAEFLATGNSSGDDRLEPLLMLREWLLKSRDLEQRYGKTERAMRAFLNGEKIGRRLIETREELFPLPEEPTADAE